MAYRARLEPGLSGGRAYTEENCRRVVEEDWSFFHAPSEMQKNAGQMRSNAEMRDMTARA